MTAEIQPIFGERLQDFWRGNLQFFLRHNREIDLDKLTDEKNNSELEAFDDGHGLDELVVDDSEKLAASLNLATPDEDASDEHVQDEEDPILVENAKADPSAFGILYERYIGRIYAYIYKRVGNKQDTEELTARTFYNALSKLNSYEDRGYPFSAWLFRIAHNIVANWHRDSGRRRLLPLDRLWSYSQDVETPDQEVERKEKHSALWAAINRLPQERRELLTYKFSNCLSNVEIGAMMNKSESAIKSLYWRTLAALRQDLESAEL